MTADPHLWLEDVEAPAALDWVRARDERTLAALQGDRRYAGFEADARRILLAPDRIAPPALRDGWIYEYWQDAAHVRGVWRRARPDEYAKASPRWETLLDVDALAAAEGENWVWKEASFLPGEAARCLVHLSRGGRDATVVRELDLGRRVFVDKGFFLPEAKSTVTWETPDSVFVCTDFGPGSLTRSGYPRIVKRWKRGTPLAAAETIFEGAVEDVAAVGFTVFRPEGAVSFLVRARSFFEQDWLVELGGRWEKLPIPPDAEVAGAFHGHVIFSLRRDWSAGARRFAAGALLSLPLARVTAPKPEEAVEEIYLPGDRASFRQVIAGATRLFVSTLEEVQSVFWEARRDDGRWKLRRLALPSGGVVVPLSADGYDDRLLFQFESFLVPTSISLADGDTIRPLRRLPARFDADTMHVESLQATSADGTRVPYFIVGKKDRALDGANPTLLYGYGGFGFAVTPFYLGVWGKAWVERGGLYVVANIRGGGELGTHWHEKARKENRQRAYDDFAAVARDLVARGYTTSRRLAAKGGSNGGLLAGVALTQTPELYRAVICQAPLLDMLRYHHLLAGNSWIGEYGDPDDATMATALRRYSPYHNVRKDARYPRPFFMTSTKDDRVHPGHARKMVARMEEYGHAAWLWENLDGGHSLAANLEHRVMNAALELTYLSQEIVD